MKWIAIFLISSSVWANEQCDKARSSLFSIEQDIHRSHIGEICSEIKPETIQMNNLSSGSLDLLNKMKCSTLGEIDQELADIEADLVIHDGLLELRNQVIANQNSVKAGMNSQDQMLLKEISEDVTLGLVIQQLIDSPDLKEIFNNNVSDLGWVPHMDKHCTNLEESKKVTPFCSTWKTYGPKSFRDNKSGIKPADFVSFMDEMRTQLDSDHKLTSQKKQNLLSTLKVNYSGKDIDFEQLHETLSQVEITDFLKATTLGAAPKFTSEQINFVKNLKLSAPETATPIAKELLSRLGSRRDQAHLKSQAALLQQSFADESLRQNARVKSKLSTLLASPSSAAPCLDKSNLELADCIEEKFPVSPDETMNRYKTALINSAKKANQTKLIGETCSRLEVINAWANEETPSYPECNAKILNDRSSVEEKRNLIIALRDFHTSQKDVQKDLKFRDFAYEIIAKECKNKFDIKELISPNCRGLETTSSLDPMLQLSSDTIYLLHEGMKPDVNSPLTKADCPEGQDDKYVTLCQMAFNPRKVESNLLQDFQASPNTIGTDAPTRTRDPIVMESISNAAADLANTWTRNRLNKMRQQQPAWTTPSFQPMPYSRPVSMSMSDYVMANATFYGGYGQYYQCATCGFGSGPQAFNQYWGLNSSPVAGMGSSGLAGTNLTSRFFGGSMGSAGPGSFSF